jgi:hypothetical protein
MDYNTTKIFCRAYNKEQTIYGLKITGLMFAFAGSIIAIIKLGIIWFMIGSIPGYIIGSIISIHIHKGHLQKWLYWNTPLIRFLIGRKLPPSWQRSFV